MSPELNRMIIKTAETFRDAVGKALSRVFSDRYELLVFLGALLAFSVTWRLSFFINDSWTVANTLVAVADGQVHLTSFPYGTEQSPGMHVVDGRLYGRNYGQVVLSLPVLVGLNVAAKVADLNVIIALGWGIGLFPLVSVAGTNSNRQQAAQITAGVVGVGMVVSGIYAPQRIGPRARPLMALQLSTMVAATLTAVLVYRLVRDVHGAPYGLFAGTAVVLSTPVAFWSTIPKRHALTAMLPLLAIYWFYRSRAAASTVEATRFRAMTYVPVGVTAWIHAPEGLVLFVSLGTVDLLTARSNDTRQLAVVGTVLLLATLPMLVTNMTISGNPFEPPRALTSFDGVTTFVLDDSGRIPDEFRPAGSPSSGGGPGRPTLVAMGTSAVEKGLVFGQYMVNSVRTAFDLERIYHVFVRGRVGLGIALRGDDPLNLSVLESMPLLGPLLAIPAILYERMKEKKWQNVLRELKSVRGSAKRATDLIVVVYITILVVLYMPRLPLSVTFTVRYLHPIYPLGLYLVVRLGFVRRVIDTEWRLLVRSYATLVLLGTPLFLLTVLIITDNPSEAVQLNAALALGAATVLGYVGFVSALSKTEHLRGGAVALAFAGAITTIFLVFSPFVYFRNTTNFALPIARLVAESLVLW